mgnify:FL=1
MKIIALCSVDESVLRSTLELGEKNTIDADTVTSEFGWLNDSGIVLDEFHETKKVEKVTEYWGFIWNLKREKYVPITIPCSNVDYCRSLMEAYSRFLTNSPIYDVNRTLICKRKVYKAYGDWEKC